jgi:hypothetical protein
MLFLLSSFKDTDQHAFALLASAAAFTISLPFIKKIKRKLFFNFLFRTKHNKKRTKGGTISRFLLLAILLSVGVGLFIGLLFSWSIGLWVALGMWPLMLIVYLADKDRTRNPRKYKKPNYIWDERQKKWIKVGG